MMKKSFKKLTSLALALCLTASMSVAVSAASYSKEGSYNTQGWVATGSCGLHKIYMEIGSSSEYLLYAEAKYYYDDVDDGREYIGYMGTSHSKHYAMRGSSFDDTIRSVIVTHTVNNSTVYVTPRLYS